MTAGAPREYDRLEILGRLREEMAKGTRNMEQICEDEGMPTPESIYLWIQDDEQLFKIFMRAQELWCFAQRDIMIQIADDQSRDQQPYKKTYGETVEEGTKSDNTAVNRDRLRVMARQWAMAKLAPKHFGERLEQIHSGEVSIVPSINIGAKTRDPS